MANELIRLKKSRYIEASVWRDFNIGPNLPKVNRGSDVNHMETLAGKWPLLQQNKICDLDHEKDTCTDRLL